MLRRTVTSALLGVAAVLRKASNTCTAVAAGVCDLDELIARTRGNWNQHDPIRLLEAPSVFAGLMEWEKPLAAMLKPGGVIGIIGCGAGRDLIAFARMGFTIDGVDFAPRAIRLAEHYLARAGVDVRVYCADVTEWTFPKDRYDAFMFSWFTYSYIPHAHRRIRALSSLWPKLDPEGCVIISYLPFVGKGALLSRIAHVVGRLTLNPNPPMPGDEFTRTLSYEHHFTPEEIAAEAHAARFDVVSRVDGAHAIAVLKKRSG